MRVCGSAAADVWCQSEARPSSKACPLANGGLSVAIEVTELPVPAQCLGSLGSGPDGLLAWQEELQVIVVSSSVTSACSAL